MAALTLVITDAGRAALVNAAHSGTNAVQIAAVGVSATPIVASAATAALPGEVKRIATISGQAVAANVIHLIVSDETADAYQVNSFALYLADGTLFAGYGQQDAILQKATGALMLLAIDVTLADIAAAQITFGNTNFIDPPATTDTAGVVQLATLAQAQANDGSRAITAAVAKAALLTWLGFTPANKAGDTFGGSIARDAQFYMNLLNGNPLFNFDANDFLYYDRAADALVVTIAAAAALRVSAAGLMIAGNTAWHAGNDGAGSGLDADLLDGRDSSSFVSKAGDTFTGAFGRDLQFYLNLLNGNPLFNFDDKDFLYYDRAADALNLSIGALPVLRASAAGIAVPGDMSVQGSFFSQNAAGDRFVLAMQPDHNGVLYVQAAGGAQKPVLSTLAGSNVVAFVAGPNVGGQTIWHAGNDGAGSGLDADLLDGRDSSSFVSKAGDTFAGAFGRDAQFYLNLLNGNPLFNFDANDFLYYDRAADTLVLTIAGVPIMKVSAASIAIPGNLSVLGSFFAQNAAGDRFVLAMQPDHNGVLYVQAAGGAQTPVLSTLAGTNVVAFVAGPNVGGQTIWHAGNDGAGSGLDADLLDGRDSTSFVSKAGDTFIGAFGRDAQFYLNLLNGNPLLNFDAADFLYYDRAADVFYLTIGGTQVLKASAGGIAVPGDMSVQGSFFSQNAAGDRFVLAMQADHNGVLYVQAAGGAQKPILSTLAGTNVVSFVAGPNVGGQTIWHAGNDGAGSGLDADLLDGRDSTSFVSKAGDAMTGDLANTGRFIARNANGDSLSLIMQGDRNGVLYIQAANGALSPVLGVLATGSVANFFTTPTTLGSTMWHAGNDGAGSGLDADLLDGLDSPAILGDFGSNANGYWERRRKADGTIVIEQWGRASVTSGNIVTVTFPLKFTDASSINVESTNEIGSSNTAPTSWPGIGRIAVDSCDIISAQASGSAVNGFGVKWRAIGR